MVGVLGVIVVWVTFPKPRGLGDSMVETSLASRLTLGSTDSLVLSGNLFPKFQGPYLEKFNSGLPPEKDIGEEDFLELDQLMDPLVGVTDAEGKLRERAKWDAANNGTLLLYMAHR